MGQDSNQFIGGMDKNSDPHKQKPNTILNALNFVALSEDGNMFSVSNESGTELMSNIIFPSGFSPIGHSILNNDIIVILADKDGNSQVGYIIEDDSPDPVYGFYHPSGPVDATGTPVTNNKELGFKQEHPVDCVSRNLINGHRLLYFTDNKVPYGYFDLDDPPVVGNVSSTVKLTFNQKIPKIEVTEIVEGVQSSIMPGIVQFITRYITKGGGRTVFGLPSAVFPMVPTSKSDGASGYSGAFYEDGNVGKNLVVNFTNVDTKYQELEIVALYYESSASTFNASVVGQAAITPDGEIEFVYTGPDTENLINLTKEELQKIVVSYTHAKCIEQKDNTLFLSNLRDDRAGLSSDLQKVANAIRVKYKIENVQFSGRGDDVSSSSLVFSEIAAPYKVGSNRITLSMNEVVDQPTGTLLTTYQLNKSGTPASASITLVDFAQFAAGDTITIAAPPAGYVGSQLTVIITAVAAGTIPAINQFAIGTDNATTIQNIYQALYDSQDIVEFSCNQPSGLVIDLNWNTVDTTVNNTTITSSKTAAVTATNFLGANTTSVTVNPTAVLLTTVNNGTADATDITLTFAAPISIGDELCIIGPGFDNVPVVTSPVTAAETYLTGSTPDGLIVVGNAPSSAAAGASVAGFTDYTNEFLTATKKGYRRGEVYSLGFKLLYKDGTMSPAYHIPGHNGYATVTGLNPPTLTDAWPASNVGNGAGTGYVGTYVSEDDYSSDQNYPGNLPGDDVTKQGASGIVRNIRHHYIPTLSSEPHYTNTAGVEFIRVLGLEFIFDSASPIPSNIITECDDIIFLRERRNTDNNKSVYAQGVIHKHMVTADSFDNDGDVLGAATTTTNSKPGLVGMRNQYHITEIPFFNLSFAVSGLSAYRDNGSYATSGMVNPWRSNGFVNQSYSNGRRFESQNITDQIMFHSPESNLLTGFKLKADNIEGYSLTQELIMKGNISKVTFRPDTAYHNTNGIFYEHYLKRFTYADLFGNYNEIEDPTSLDISSANNRTIEKARYLEANVQENSSLDPDNPVLKTNTKWNTGGLQLLLNQDSYSAQDNSGDAHQHRAAVCIKNTFMSGGNSTHGIKYPTSLRYTDSNSFNGPTATVAPYTNEPRFDGSNDHNLDKTPKEHLRSLYNIKISQAKQYGQINKATYIPIKRIPIKDVSGNFISTYTGVYGGDTFITKYAFNCGSLVRYDPFRDTGTDPISSAGKTYTGRTNGYANPLGGRADGWDFRTCTYYFVESNINTHYRHAPDDDFKQDYFPNEKNIATMLNNFLPPLGRIQAYNTQYSYEDTVIYSFLAGSSNELISDFQNRTIYSEKAANDDTLDTYRSFLQNDYYDLPSETGPIWDTFVDYDILFMHTPKSLWKTFAEPAASLSGSNISDVVLGATSLFSRPSTQIMEAEGGYGGTLSQFGGIHTKIGYIFVDVLQGKVFSISSTKKAGMFLNELSKEGMSTFMHKNIPLGITEDATGQTDLTNVTTKNSHLIDNPYLGIGITGGYDYKLDRYFLIKFKNTDDPNGFTVSYIKDIKNWFSFHNYSPDIIIPYNNRVLFVRRVAQLTTPFTVTSEVHEMNIGPKGSYFGTVYDSEIEYVVVSKERSAIFNTININSKSTVRATGVKAKQDNFYSIQVSTDRSNTGEYRLVHNNTFGTTKTAGEVFIKYRNDEYRMAIPRDSVINNSLDIFDSTNLNNASPSIRERIKGIYAIFKLKYDNSSNLQFVLNDIKTIFINNFR